jgi:hypothetical protein
MFRMAVGHSDDIDLDQAMAAVLAKCDAALGGVKPRAGLLYGSWDADHQRLADTVMDHYPQIELAGATSAGEMSSVIGLAEDSVALALFASDTVEITAGLGRNLKADPAGAAREAVDQARAKASSAPRLCITLPMVGGYDSETVFASLRAALGPDVPVVGGGSAPEDPAAAIGVTQSRQIVGREVTEDSIPILLFSGALVFSVGVETGWHGVGPRGVVTKASAAGVFEIDDRPAIEFYERYVGLGQPPLGNPLAVFESPTSPTFYLRTPTSSDPATGLVGFFGPVPQGVTVQITTAGTEQIFDGTRASVNSALAAFPEGHSPDAALIYSCATRRFLLGTRAGHEVELVQEALGAGVPVAGFYCLGEIAPNSSDLDATRFHNATLVSVLLGAA